MYHVNELLMHLFFLKVFCKLYYNLIYIKLYYKYYAKYILGQFSINNMHLYNPSWLDKKNSVLFLCRFLLL